MLQGIRRQDRIQPPPPEELERLRGIAAAFTREPRSLTELREHLVEHAGDRLAGRGRVVAAPAGDVHPRAVGRRRRGPSVDVRGSWTRRPGCGDPAPFAPVDDALDHLARRYLAAFGPAIGGRPRPVVRGGGRAAAPGARSARGRPARCAGSRTSAARTCSISSTRRGRRRACPRHRGCCRCGTACCWPTPTGRGSSRDADRAIVIAKNGDTLPTFTVDGRVAGLWWAERDDPGADPHIVLEPFRADPRRGTTRPRARSARRLAAFIAPHEPTVYSRYQRWRPGR